jgi:hypothetical protein
MQAAGGVAGCEFSPVRINIPFVTRKRIRCTVYTMHVGFAGTRPHFLRSRDCMLFGARILARLTQSYLSTIDLHVTYNFNLVSQKIFLTPSLDHNLSMSINVKPVG